MNALRLLPVILSGLMLGAHFFRARQLGAVLICLIALLLLFSRRRYVPLVVQGGLLAGTIIWILTIVQIVELRQMMGQAWIRLVIILTGVSLFTAGSVFMFRLKPVRRRYAQEDGHDSLLATVLLATGLAGGLITHHTLAPVLSGWGPNVVGWLMVLAIMTLVARAFDNFTQKAPQETHPTD